MVTRSVEMYAVSVGDLLVSCCDSCMGRQKRVLQSSSSSSSDGTNKSFSSRKFATFLLIAAPINRPGITEHKMPIIPNEFTAGIGLNAPVRWCVLQRICVKRTECPDDAKRFNATYFCSNDSIILQLLIFLLFRKASKFFLFYFVFVYFVHTSCYFNFGLHCTNDNTSIFRSIVLLFSFVSSKFVCLFCYGLEFSIRMCRKKSSPKCLLFLLIWDGIFATMSSLICNKTKLSNVFTWILSGPDFFVVSHWT